MFIQISFLRLLINKIKSVCDKKSYILCYCIDGLSFHGEHKSPARMTQEPKANKKEYDSMCLIIN